MYPEAEPIAAGREGDGGGMMSELLVALGLKAAVRGHHREHDECPHEELRRMDSELAGKIEVMAW